MSCFLPEDFDASRSLAFIAGQGNYPILLAERARKAGVQIRLIELGGETSPELIESFPDNERSAVKVGQVGKLLKELDPVGEGWDGTFIGRPMPQSDYWFRVFLEDGREFKGHFSLVRGFD